ncbi:hypothetical protein BLA9940_00033 [Burkholderia aenigmatica]|uniref:hypothetical protein n=1 Tax=Burkholderia cepacia complex TaxID=87882 RepID=UPI0013DE225B|nr:MULTISPECIES: hypothetical protein [Burkholderia cepacia complex]VWC30383.1 hypothetical protein BLA9940_00033 [Burkholderia aenigmatica]
MNAHVDLPSDPLINILLFGRAIARAIIPAGERELNGIECVIQKRVNLGVFPGQLKADVDSRVREGTNPPQHAIGSNSVAAQQSDSDWIEQSDLTSVDRATLQALLPHLPPLSGPMSEQEVEVFTDAYRKLSDRPNWEPVLFTTALIDRRKAEQDSLMHFHMQALWDEVRDGRLKLLDRGHRLVENPNAGDFIRRKDALAYLEQCGLTEGAARDVIDAGEVGPDRGLSDEVRNEGGEKRAAERRRAIYDYCNQMYLENIKNNKRYENHNELTADKFQISPSRVRAIIRKEDRERGVVSPWRKKVPEQWCPSS